MWKTIQTDNGSTDQQGMLPPNIQTKLLPTKQGLEGITDTPGYIENKKHKENCLVCPALPPLKYKVH
uniref:Uncharacterized protein n=1 Tax=Arundo donax TaxID=35708 RepID=A0A0A9EUT2_ARUDO